MSNMRYCELHKRTYFAPAQCPGCASQILKPEGERDYRRHEDRCWTHHFDCAIDEIKRLTVALEQVQAYKPYPADQALAGPDMPPMKTILDVARYCTTVHARFGNTCVAGVSLKWGASALNFKDNQAKRIEQLEALLNRWLGADDWALRDGFEVSIAAETRAALGTAEDSE